MNNEFFQQNISNRNKIYIVVGVMGTGKTTVTKEVVIQYIKKRRKNVLIFDINNEYAPIKEIRPEDVQRTFNTNDGIPKIRRIVPDSLNFNIKKNEDPVEEAAITTARNFRNGLLVLEDIGQYMSDVRKKRVYGALISLRHKGVDIIFIFHSLGDIHKKLRNLASIYRIHFTYDNMQECKKRFYNFQNIAIAHGIVQHRYKNGDKYAYVYADMANNKISGVFNEMDFRYACKNAYNIIKPIEDFNTFFLNSVEMLKPISEDGTEIVINKKLLNSGKK